MIKKKNLKKDSSLIPKGFYCYSDKTCPYWDKDRKRDDQCSGYCHFLEKGDWEFKHLSLLWDQVKECGINEFDEEDIIGWEF